MGDCGDQELPDVATIKGTFERSKHATPRKDHCAGWVRVKRVRIHDPTWERAGWRVVNCRGEKSLPWRIFRPDGSYLKDMLGRCLCYGSALAAIKTANAHIQVAEWKAEDKLNG